MGVLVPLYLAGLAALSLPLIFHLVRRTPHGRQDFSSLMFLSPTPPKLTRRSRLDQILLLLLRLAALALLVFAFARPFLREAASLAMGDLPGRKVAILIDTSASMRRGDLWQQATKLAEKELADLNPQDDVALLAFHLRRETVLDFDRSGAARVPDKPQLARQRLKGMRPSWGATDLGKALIETAGELAATTDVQQSFGEPQIIVISDFQKGGRIDALDGFEWPKDVRVIAKTVRAPRKTNAFAHLLPSDEDDDDPRPRVRVVNAADSAGDQFFVRWHAALSGVPRDVTKGKTPGEAAVYVPAGQSRVVRLPRPAEALTADKLVLRGDDHHFDNTHFVVPPRKQQLGLLYVGGDAADDPQGLQYYLRLAVANDPLREVTVTAADASEIEKRLAAPAPQLVVVAQAISAADAERLTAYAEHGGSVLLVARDRETAASVSRLLDDVQIPAEETTRADDDLLLGEIDFTHPLFVPFASPRYSDFTKIHFWKAQRLDLQSPATSRVVARFDNRSPAILERAVGTGRVIAIACGWSPDDSQFALSGKFVAVFGGLLDLAAGGTPAAASITVHEPMPLPKTTAQSLVVTSPGKKETKVAATASTFDATSEPGIYNLQAADVEARFAVNLNPAESDTSPLDLEQLEQRGVKFQSGLTRAERIDRLRQQRDTELEGRQKVWRWLIAATLVLLVIETWWAGRAAGKIQKAMEASP